MYTEGVNTDDEIRSLLRQRVDTVYHPVGTCKMGVNDPMAVVDPKLRVYGLAGLRVVDASVMPTLIGGNTNAPTIMIGEKAADMIKAEMRAGEAAPVLGGAGTDDFSDLDAVSLTQHVYRNRRRVRHEQFRRHRLCRPGVR